MKYKRLQVEKEEYAVLKQLLHLEGPALASSMPKHLYKLQAELREANVLNEADMVDDVVRLNSLVTISTIDNSWTNTFRLVLPTQSNAKEKKISVLLPMGAAVLGYAKGDPIQWEFPGGIKELKVVDVVQHTTQEK